MASFLDGNGFRDIDRQNKQIFDIGLLGDRQRTITSDLTDRPTRPGTGLATSGISDDVEVDVGPADQVIGLQRQALSRVAVDGRRATAGGHRLG